MKRLLSVLFPALILTQSGCFIDDVFDCERGNGKVVRESLQVDGFDGIRLEVVGNVYLSQGDQYSVEVVGEENVVDLIEEDVRRGVWDIEFRRCVKNYDKLDFYITMPEIKTLTVSGSGSLYGDSILVSENLDLNISGSGLMDVEVECDHIEGFISGSGQMKLSGISDDLDFSISGSGDLKAFDLTVRKADIRISGSGDAELTVTEYLDVRISGSGDVFYKGTPDTDVQISGSGKVIRTN